MNRRTDKAARAPDGESHLPFAPQSGSIEMLLFIVLALLVILTKSLIPLLATDPGLSFDAAVAIAGLLSYIGLYCYIWRLQVTAGKSFDCFRRGAALAERNFETTEHLQQGFAVRPARRPGSSLIRRLVRAKDDPAKRRIRAQLSEIDDERLSCLGLTAEDIAALRGAASPPVEAIIASQVSPPIAGHLDATDAAPQSDPPGRECVSLMLSA
jgi:uncharacterized protein YjiS (DUF1127 family)